MTINAWEFLDLVVRRAIATRPPDGIDEELAEFVYPAYYQNEVVRFVCGEGEIPSPHVKQALHDTLVALGGSYEASQDGQPIYLRVVDGIVKVSREL
jgi:hypothetical protein